jgi:hypothetical protein
VDAEEERGHEADALTQAPERAQADLARFHDAAPFSLRR